MGKIKALEYTCGVGVMIVGLGLYSYYVRELLASLFLFSVVFFSMSLVVLSVFFAWCASKQVALFTKGFKPVVAATELRFLLILTGLGPGKTQLGKFIHHNVSRDIRYTHLRLF